MKLVELYTGPDCHLCEDAKEVLTRIQQSHPFELRQITIREGEGRYEELRERIPVVFIDGTFAFQHRVPEAEFIRALAGK